MCYTALVDECTMAPAEVATVTIDPSSPIPIFRQIVELIRRSIAAGVYRPGEMIPSLRASALELKVNPNTVQRAHEELERQGLVRARKGLGMFVTHRAASRARMDSREAARQVFTEGIQAALAAGMSPASIRSTFAQAWKEVGTRAKT